MIRKKLVVCLLTSAVALGLFGGCSSSESSSAESNSTSSSESVSDTDSLEGESVTLIMMQRDEFLSTLESGAIEAAEEYGINLTTQDAQTDQSKMIQYVETCRNNGDRAIMINLVDNSAAQQVIEAAGDMQVVLVNRMPVEEDWDKLLTLDNVYYVGSNESDAGKFQGEALADYFKEQGKTEISYILLSGTIGQDSTTRRTESVLQALEDNGITATEATSALVADWDRATAMDMISPLLGVTEFDCIIANNDAMAIGAVEAMLQADMDPSSIPIVGIDATIDGLDEIKDGNMYMSAYQNAAGQGRAALQAVVNVLTGKAVNEDTGYEIDDVYGYDHIVWVPFESVTAENVDDYL